MTLATRCPACGTVFRVVQDQLRVSQGWVRCGRCSEAFNAVEAMVESPSAPVPAVDPGPPAAIGPAMPRPSQVAGQGVFRSPVQQDALANTRSVPAASATLFAHAVPAANDREACGFVDQAAAASASTLAAALTIDLPPGLELIASDGAISIHAEGLHSLPERVEPSFEFDASAVEPDGGPAVAEPPREHALPPTSTDASPLTAAISPTAAADSADPFGGPPAAAPSFLVDAERSARWRRPGVRIVLVLVAALAALGLAMQVAYAFRDRLAATAPALRPMLQQACNAWGCRIGDLRQIDALSVESSGLVRVEGAPVYRLSVTLRNRSTVEVAAPAIDLALTDAQGRQIARRVLQMSDLDLPLRNLKAGSELPIQVPLSVGDRAVSGYTVEIFYP